MSLLQRWFIKISSGLGRFLWIAFLLTLIVTVAGQALLILPAGRRFLNPVESLEGGPWPPQEGIEGSPPG